MYFTCLTPFKIKKDSSRWATICPLYVAVCSFINNHRRKKLTSCTPTVHNTNSSFRMLHFSFYAFKATFTRYCFRAWIITHICLITVEYIGIKNVLKCNG